MPSVCTLFCVKLNSGMQFCSIRAFVLIAVAALLGNAQCYGKCPGTACGSAHVPSTSCHHPQKPSHDDARCPHQHSEFASPEVRIAQIGLTIGTLGVPVLAVDSAAVFADSQVWVPRDTGPPPGDVSFSIFVLRI